MNALVIRTLDDGVDLSLQTDDADPKAKLLAEYLYQMILKFEDSLPEPEVTQ